MRRLLNILLAGALLAAGAYAGLAQEQVAAAKTPRNEKPTAPKAEVAKAEEKGDKTAPAESATEPQNNQECKLCRWFELQMANISYRYRFVTTSGSTSATTGAFTPGYMLSKQSQHREMFKGRIKFDSEGKYTLNLMASTGYTFSRTFVGGGLGHTYSSTGAVTSTGFSADRNSTNIFLRWAYLAAKPVKGLEVQFGSMPINKGVNTEFTSYDDDGYIMGTRVILTRPKQLFFDEVSVTGAYLGDYNTSNFFHRAHRYNDMNYYQFLVSKKIGDRAVASADWTIHKGWDVLREAVKVNTKETKVLDSVRFETYQRITDIKPIGTSFTGSPRAWGFALTGEKSLGKRLTLGGGYVSVDNNYDDIGTTLNYRPATRTRAARYSLSGGSTLNSDKMYRGNHLLFTADYKLSPEFSVSAWMARGVHNDPTVRVSRDDSVYVAINYNLLNTLRRFGWFK